MDQIYDNRYYSAGSREPSSRRAHTVRLGGPDYTGAARPTHRTAGTSHSHAQMNMSMHRPDRPSRATDESRSSAQTHDKSSRPSSRLSGSDFMHYAHDNAVVKAIYDFTHGPQRGLFIGIVVALVLVSLYFPVRDLYVAKRSSDILAKQVEIRQQYNDELQKSVDKLLSEEGIKTIRIRLRARSRRTPKRPAKWPRRLRKSARTRRGTSRRLTCCLGLTASRARRSCPTANSAPGGVRNGRLQTI